MIVDMKMFVNAARLEIGQLFVVYSRYEAAAAVYFGHISSLFCFSLTGELLVDMSTWKAE